MVVKGFEWIEGAYGEGMICGGGEGVALSNRMLEFENITEMR